MAFPVPLSRGGFGGCVWVWLLCVVSPLGGRYDSRYYDSEHYYFRLYCSGGARISSCETSQR
ncbi:hypothetical protein D0B97_19180 [Vibrio cholerae]|nr:hypothetical protein [Vibrio cholerae]